MQLYAQSPERMSQYISDRLIQIIIAVYLKIINPAHQQPFAVVPQGLQHPMFRFQMFSPDLRVIGAGEDHFYFVHPLECQRCLMSDV